MIYYYLSLVGIALVAYLIGCFNFARIFTFGLAKKDITQVGSHNPGTMNVLRTQGFGEAVLTLVFESLKSGLPALISYYVMEHFFAGSGNLAFFLAGVCAVLGHCFPVFYKFKGGKGVACTFGMFTFHPAFWWVSLIAFIVLFLTMMFLIKIGSLISFFYIFIMSTISTIYFCVNKIPNLIFVLVLIWLNVLLILIMHRANIKRLAKGTEGTVDLLGRVKSSFNKNKKDGAEENAEVSKVEESEDNKTENAEASTTDSAEEKTEDSDKEKPQE